MTERSPAGGRTAGGGSPGAPGTLGGPGAARASEAGASEGSGAATVFFLSDYGLVDEFVGVVHAVLRRAGPVGVVDLTHGIAPFDVRGGTEALQRALPHLGPGVVLGVVDPGVGGDRRGIAVLSAGGRWFVGPDNGLLPPAVGLDGGPTRAIALDKSADAPATFDGRDVF
ncbi:MAG: SAM-dependent chlorinase/fluorinase, partial [Acidimicrobiales bacterium]